MADNKYISKYEKMRELQVTERQIRIWDLLSKGASQREVAKELGHSLGTVNLEINKALEAIRGWAGRNAEDWRNAQLLLIGEQISQAVADTTCEPEPMTDEDGNWIYAKNGAPRYFITPLQARQMRSTARNTLIRLLDHQAKLLALSTVKTEVKETKQIAIAVIRDIDGAHADTAPLLEAL